MAALAANSGTEFKIPLGSGFVLYSASVNIAADADTFECPLTTIKFALASQNDASAVGTDVDSLTWATNVITFNDPVAAHTSVLLVVGTDG